MNLFANPAPRREGSIFDRRTQLQKEGTVYVIGAVNMDLSGTPAGTLRTGDSNPGRITLSPGGVGHNIAENLRLLGRKVSLITIMGEDTYADVIREHCLNAGIDLQYSFTDPMGRTSAYLCINEQNGDLNVAVSDMTICDELTPARLEPLLPVLNHGSMVIADANLPEETIAWIAKNVTVPVAADPVSLTHGRNCFDPAGKIRMALHRMGVRRVYISLGSRGVWADDAREGGMLIPCAPCTVVNTTGCGDAFVAAAADAYLNGLNTMDAARRALAASAICAEDPAAVSSRLSQEAIEIKLSLPM